MKKNNLLIFIFLLAAPAASFSQQASLTVVNKSDRFLTVKIMKDSEKKFTLYSTNHVDPNGKQLIYFSEAGRYFIKSCAIPDAKDTLMRESLYGKGNPVMIVADKKRGYSNIIMKYSVKESKKPVQEGVINITRKEYEED
jgi:hypothetical protein